MHFNLPILSWIVPLKLVACVNFCFLQKCEMISVPNPSLITAQAKMMYGGEYLNFISLALAGDRMVCNKPL